MELEPYQLERIRRLVEYKQVIGSLKGASWASIVFGGLLALSCLAGFDASVTCIIGLLLGVGLFASGLHLMRDPSLGGVALGGLCLLALSAWNFTVSIVEINEVGMAESEGALKWIVMAVIQFGLAVYTFRLYYRLSGTFPEPPSQSSLRTIDTLISGVEEASARQDDNIVEFDVASPRDSWKAMLTSEFAVFIGKRGAFIVESKDSVEIQPRRKVVFKSKFKATLTLNSKKMKIVIGEEHLNRFVSWKEATYTGSVENPALGQPTGPGDAQPEVPFVPNSPYFANRS